MLNKRQKIGDSTRSDGDRNCYEEDFILLRKKEPILVADHYTQEKKIQQEQEAQYMCPNVVLIDGDRDQQSSLKKNSNSFASIPLSVEDTPSICASCGYNLSFYQKSVLFNRKLYHEHCFVCSVCECPLENGFLQKDGKPYCENDFPKSSAESKASNKFVISIQPEKFQVANYNIYPSPSLTFEGASKKNHTVYANLVENGTKCVVDGGFQSGDVRVLRIGQNSVGFPGLKLNKMGPIKNVLNHHGSHSVCLFFCIEFKFDSYPSVYSQPFKLISSCSQLPVDLRNHRPLKRPQSNSRIAESSPDGNHLIAPTPELQFPTLAVSKKPLFVPHLEHLSTAVSSVSYGGDLQNEIQRYRLDLENSIRNGNPEASGYAAQRLALLHKLLL